MRLAGPVAADKIAKAAPAPVLRMIVAVGLVAVVNRTVGSAAGIALALMLGGFSVAKNVFKFKYYNGEVTNRRSA